MRLRDIYETQLSDIDTKYSPTEGTFTKSGKEIAEQLLKDASSPGQAMRRLSFYMNRAGKNLKNKSNLEEAKKIIRKKVEEDFDK